MNILPTGSFVIIYHTDMTSARWFYEELLGPELREVLYEWFVGYWVSEKHKITLCIGTSPEEVKK